MKAVKRNSLVVDENILLNEINNSQESRYFNPSDFNIEDTINLHFDYSEGFGTEYIPILAIYIDTSKSMKTFEGIEFKEEFRLPYPERGITRNKEFSISMKHNEDSKLLWKIGFQIRPQVDSLIHLTVS